MILPGRYGLNRQDLKAAEQVQELCAVEGDGILRGWPFERADSRSGYAPLLMSNLVILGPGMGAGPGFDR